AFWINKPDQDLDNRWLFGSYSGWSFGATSFLIWKDEDPAHGNVTYFCVQGKNNHGCCSYQNLEYKKWVHVAATYDKTQVRLYVNGVQAGSSGFSEEVSSTSGKWYIGYNPGNQIMGMIDEVAVFNLALTVDDINEIMNEGLEAALGIISVDLSGKLAATWGSIKLFK
ncbi:LamG domain-containing protein, partial [Candidatus Dojkabacteria bacterium]|nr:LamG domain-containing protein [Candidatus Dojkabacteria bacterium]